MVNDLRQRLETGIASIKSNWPPDQYTMLREALTLAVELMEQALLQQPRQDDRNSEPASLTDRLNTALRECNSPLQAELRDDLRPFIQALVDAARRQGAFWQQGEQPQQAVEEPEGEVNFPGPLAKWTATGRCVRMVDKRKPDLETDTSDELESAMVELTMVPPGHVAVPVEAVEGMPLQLRLVTQFPMDDDHRQRFVELAAAIDAALERRPTDG